MNDTVKQLEVMGVVATRKTSWMFVRLTSADGIVGFGEATLNGRDEAVIAVAQRYGKAVLGMGFDRPERIEANLPFSTLPEAAFSSATMQALWDLKSRVQHTSLAEALGGPKRTRIPVYANINRRTVDRSPAGFAESAEDAIRAGFDTVKIAPFDDIRPGMDATEFAGLLDGGVARIAAVRACIGPERRIFIDCHYRFDAPSAVRAIDAAAALKVQWFECPINEVPENIESLKILRAHANKKDMFLVGGEYNVKAISFDPYLKVGAYDIMMPDVKYCGGPAEISVISKILAEHGVKFSPHNPTGPICHAVSLQVSSAASDLYVLEHQFGETPTFHAIVAGELPKITQGVADVTASRPGIGVDLNDAFARQLERTGYWQARTEACPASQ